MCLGDNVYGETIEVRKELQGTFTRRTVMAVILEYGYRYDNVTVSFFTL